MKCYNFQNHILSQIFPINKTNFHKKSQFKQSQTSKKEFPIQKLKSTKQGNFQKTHNKNEDYNIIRAVAAGPTDKSDIDLTYYENKFPNKLLMILFKNKLIEALDGEKSQKQGYH